MAVCLLLSTSARAQGALGPVTFSGGVRWAAPVSVGQVDATEIGVDGKPYRLFSTASRFEGTFGGEGRIGVRLTKVLRAEGAFSYGIPTLATRVSGDAEGARSTTATEGVRQFTFEGGIALLLPRWRPVPRGSPFLTVGVGYLRQLHEGRTLAEDGRSGFVGVGMDVVLRERRGKRLKAVGVRGDARAAVRGAGLSLDRRSHVVLLLGTSLFFSF